MFTDRIHAGRQLGERLRHLRGQDVVVVGLPRGGVPVAAEVARALDAPMDVIVVRKLGVPFQPELAMGAIGEGGVRVLNRHIQGLTAHDLDVVEQRERVELQRRARRFRAGRPAVPLAGRVVVVVDDGVATGATARAACQVARAQGAARVVLAVPVAPPGWTARFADDADELVCLSTPSPFRAVGQFYAEFGQTSDEEVVACLHRSDAARQADVGSAEPAPRRDAPPVLDADVVLAAGAVRLGGHLTVPTGAVGVVVFVHGSGSSRHSPRNHYVAEVLHGAGLATMLFDLLTPAEEHDRANVFDIELLASRLGSARAWVRGRSELAGLPVGFFGASTGAGAALWAAGAPDADVAAIVSRGGRPDLASPRLAGVQAPTLLIVGGHDPVVERLNREAAAQLRCPHRVAVVPGASHLFEEPGTLHRAAELASDWFLTHLPASRDEEAGAQGTRTADGPLGTNS